MNLNQLYYFRTVARLQHFTRAAEELNVSQPSLSYAMTTLEDELETYLFEKRGRNVVLTKYGRLFLTHVEKSLEELEFGQKQLRKLTSSQEGRIDIAYLYPLAPRYIPKMVRSFLDVPDNNKISFTFYQGISSSLISGLKSQKYDVIFSSYAENEPEIEFVPLFQQDLVAVVPQGHPLEDRKIINLADMAEYPMVIYNRETGLGKLTQEIFQKTSLTPTIISEAENEQALYGLVAENFGISLVANIPEIRNYNIKAIPVEDPLCSRYIYLGYLKNCYLAPSVKRFISYARTAEFEI